MVDMKVAELIKHDRTVWDLELIREILTERDAEVISRMPLAEVRTEDEWYWRWDDSGLYRVRGAYRLLQSEKQMVQFDTPFTHWAKIWKIDVPPRLAHLLWRCVHGILPTRGVLARRRVELVNVCALCGEQNESMEHLFQLCHCVGGVWALFPGDLPPMGNDGFQRWMQQVFEGMTQTIELVAWFIDGIWLARNNLIWHGELWDTTAVFNAVMAKMKRWNERSAWGSQNAQNDMQIVNSSPSAWMPPPIGMMKVNVDAALFPEEGKVGFGFIVCDHDKQFVAASRGTLNCINNPQVAEAMAIKEVLTWIMDNMPTQRFIVETDCMVIVAKLKQKQCDTTYLGVVVRSILELMRSCEQVVVTFVKRDINSWAHRLARSVRVNLSVDPEYWSDAPPDCIHGLFVH
nr:uncharacterized protein LOC109146933 [Ipomoea batatas]